MTVMMVMIVFLKVDPSHQVWGAIREGINRIQIGKSNASYQSAIHHPPQNHSKNVSKQIEIATVGIIDMQIKSVTQEEFFLTFVVVNFFNTLCASMQVRLNLINHLLAS